MIADELLGQAIELLIPQRFRADHLKHRSFYAENPHVRSMGSGMDLAGRHKNGAEIPIEAGLSYIRVGNEMLVMASLTDISRRKQTEEMLEHRVEERTRELERRRQVSDGLRDILNVLNSNLSLEQILDHIAAQACRLLHANASAIYRMQGEQGPLILQASCGLPDDYAEQLIIPPGKVAAGHISDLTLAETVANTATPTRGRHSRLTRLSYMPTTASAFYRQAERQPTTKIRPFRSIQGIRRF